MHASSQATRTRWRRLRRMSASKPRPSESQEGRQESWGHDGGTGGGARVEEGLKDQSSGIGWRSRLIRPHLSPGTESARTPQARDAQAYKDGTLGVRARVRLQNSEWLEDLMLLNEHDRRGRVRGERLCELEEASTPSESWSWPTPKSTCEISGERHRHRVLDNLPLE